MLNSDSPSGWEVLCPQCGKGDRLEVNVKVWALLIDEGTDDSLAQDCAHDWDSNSPCQCIHCGWVGAIAEANDAWEAAQ